MQVHAVRQVVCSVHLFHMKLTIPVSEDPEDLDCSKFEDSFQRQMSQKYAIANRAAFLMRPFAMSLKASLSRACRSFFVATSTSGCASGQSFSLSLSRITSHVLLR